MTPRDAAHNAAYPSIEGGGPARLLCDEMLHRLARFLRAAGHDTALAEGGLPDREVLALARAERRTLLTRDGGLASSVSEEASDVRALRLSADSLDDCALEVRARLGINWLHAPFTRCLVDNAPLEAAGAAARARLPARTRRLGGPVRVCPSCGRLYWPGSHVRRMRARLAAWREGRC